MAAHGCQGKQIGESASGRGFVSSTERGEGLVG